jgi:hypothetical protein
VAGALFLFGVAFNLTWALHNRSHNAFEFEEAHKVTNFVGDRDLVVLDRGADSVSVMYAYLWADETQFFPYVDQAVIAGKTMLQELDDRIRSTRAAGGKVYFLGVLDIPKPTWDAFMERRCGVPYESFDRYRSSVRLITQFKSRTGLTPLWELEPQPDTPAGVQPAPSTSTNLPN